MKPKNQYRVLLVIPTLGERLKLLEETLKSAKNQTDCLLDIIVVCPKSNNKVRDLALRYGAKLGTDPGTLSGAVNVGFSRAKPEHKYLSWMGDDDLLRPGSVAETARSLDENPNAVLAFGYCIDDKGNIIFTNKAGSVAPRLLSWGPNLVPLIGMLYRKSAIQSAGEFDTSLKYAMDLDMLLRLKRLGDFVNTKKTVGAFRWHPTSTTVANRNASLSETENIKRRYLPKLLKPISPAWDIPVRIATRISASRVNSKASKMN